ncbi:hypothetical protein MVEN_01406400 [Mycena venus]|uniref:Uncharacterized protein n=1 Tax=Mycena venus TaxID=2733690 RepID=A0A8H6XWI6_9AGAR|nr:hypothetical protein MVEN_01406400 [Mycena venus]
MQAKFQDRSPFALTSCVSHFMATSYSANPWVDLDAVSKALPFGTALALKQIIISLNTECGTHMTRTGKKQDLVDRLRAQFAIWKSTNNVARWRTAKAIIDEIKLPVASFMPDVASMSMASLPRPSGATAYSSAPILILNPAHIPLPTSRSASTIGSPYPAPARAHIGPHFTPSPFFKTDQVVSPLLECPISLNPTDRRECTLHFELSTEQLAMLSAPSTTYQLRLFCTSSKFYAFSGQTEVECPIEFPQTCEIYVNEVQLKSALLKGIKKRPGTAPPPVLSLPNFVIGVRRNTVRMIYINNGGQGQLEYKKYYLIVHLVKTTPVSALVDTLRKTRFVSEAEVRGKMLASMVKDDDIIAGSLKMSLRCPLSFTRITTPSRSAKCTHSQCFDAGAWFAVMEQTTTWLCPVCENVLDWRELIVDGLFFEILSSTPDTVDDVLLDADGGWRAIDSSLSGSGSGKKLETYSSAKKLESAACPAAQGQEGVFLKLVTWAWAYGTQYYNDVTKQQPTNRICK